MTDDERSLSAYELLLKIHVIAGWSIPASQLMDILVTQLEKKLNEKYANVNSEEFEYAFRNRDLNTKDWGKSLNLTLIDEVMIPYLEQRYDLSVAEESLNRPIPIEDKRELTAEEWQEWLLDMKGYKLDMIPVAAYDYLVRENKINPTVKEKNDCIEKSIPIYIITLQEDLKIWTEFVQQKTQGVFTGRHKDGLIALSKKMIVEDYLKTI
jgi:hypothetical protein